MVREYHKKRTCLGCFLGFIMFLMVVGLIVKIWTCIYLYYDYSDELTMFIVDIMSSVLYLILLCGLYHAIKHLEYHRIISRTRIFAILIAINVVRSFLTSLWSDYFNWPLLVVCIGFTAMYILFVIYCFRFARIVKELDHAKLLH